MNITNTNAHVALLVKDYDEAIQYYTQKLNFKLLEDTPISPDKRWVVITPKEPGNCNLLLAKAANNKQTERIGNQTGGRVFLFLYTQHFQTAYTQLQENNIPIVRKPITENYGTVCVFRDLYGNLWDLIEPVKP